MSPRPPRPSRIFHLAALILLLASSLFPPLGGTLADPLDAPPPPVPLAPVDGVTVTAITEPGHPEYLVQPPLAIPEVSWMSVPGTKLYRVRFCANIACSGNPVYEVTTEITRHTPRIPAATAFSDGWWYWQVRVETPVQSAYSITMKYNKLWASPSNFPALSLPANDATLNFYDDDAFSWQPVIGAAQYRFQVASSLDGFSAPILNNTTIATSYQPTNKLPAGTYYWRVVPLDPGTSPPHEGTSSEVRSFTVSYPDVPVQFAPPNQTNPTLDFTPTFRWTAVRGAQRYRLEYSTDPQLNNQVTTVYVRNTAWTPVEPLQNDVNYYWRVKAELGTFGPSIISTAWSPIWTFRKDWDIPPILLTPTNSFAWVRFPFFNWTPVPGASYYHVEVSDTPDFNGPHRFVNDTANVFFGVPQQYWGDVPIYYWRVTPRDMKNNAGASATFSYNNSSLYTVPSQMYPLYYYPPRSDMLPRVDRTVPLPIFMWQRLTKPANPGLDMGGGDYARAYRLEVSENYEFLDCEPTPQPTCWRLDTENLSATPLRSENFTLIVGHDYYWRVHALDHIGGSLIGDDWSQVWKARFNPSLGLTPTTGAIPVLLRPARASESVETMPLFEWWPMQGASYYEIQISDDASFAAFINSAQVTYPAYTPRLSLAQRSLIKLTTYGTYYWRVRAYSGSTWSGWSQVWRFHISSQGEWWYAPDTNPNGRGILDPINRLKIAEDASGDTSDGDFDLTTLQAAQDINYWYIGFNANVIDTPMSYVLYIDIDRQDNSGANKSIRNYDITTIPAHWPEYAIAIDKTTSIAPYVTTNNTKLFKWNAGLGDWDPPQTFTSIGCQVAYDSGYIELMIANTAIGMTEETQSFSLSLFSVPTLGSTPVDSVPSDPAVPGSGPLSRFSSVSDRPNVMLPPNIGEGDPTSSPTLMPYFWDYQTGGDHANPWSGVELKAYLDPNFTSEVPGSRLQLDSSDPYYSTTNYEAYTDYVGDNTYYWRLRTRYLDNSNQPRYGAWSQGRSFQRIGFKPQDLLVSVTFATPTFSWSRVEGADAYQIQVDDDPTFNSPAVDKTVVENTYTPDNTLFNGLYYWRVRVRRYGNVYNGWTASQTFTLSLPRPTGLTPNNPNPANAVNYNPMLCWTPILARDGGSTPVLSAYRYKVQVSRDPNFTPGQIYDEIFTEHACWTPTKAYEDRTYYWHVAMLDGEDKMGNYSDTAVFTKQYPVTAWLNPASGSSSLGTPTFRWAPIFGAAYYRLEVARDKDFTNIVERVETNNTSWTPTSDYPSQRSYYWRVAMVDLGNFIGPYNEATILLGGNLVFLPTMKKHRP